MKHGKDEKKVVLSIHGFEILLEPEGSVVISRVSVASKARSTEYANEAVLRFLYIYHVPLS